MKHLPVTLSKVYDTGRWAHINVELLRIHLTPVPKSTSSPKLILGSKLPLKLDLAPTAVLGPELALGPDWAWFLQLPHKYGHAGVY